MRRGVGNGESRRFFAASNPNRNKAVPLKKFQKPIILPLLRKNPPCYCDYVRTFVCWTTIERIHYAESHQTTAINRGDAGERISPQKLLQGISPSRWLRYIGIWQQFEKPSAFIATLSCCTTSMRNRRRVYLLFDWHRVAGKFLNSLWAVWASEKSVNVLESATAASFGTGKNALGERM